MPDHSDSSSSQHESSQITVGDRVYDRESGPGNSLIVIDKPNETCEEYSVANTGKTVADFNEEYPADADVCVVAFEENIESSISDEESLSSDSLQQAIDEHNIKTYSYPAPRLVEYNQDFSQVPESINSYYELICYQHARMIHLAAGADNYAFLWTKYKRLVDGEIEMTSITKEDKYLLQEDFGVCIYCGQEAETEYDHVIPISKGGSADISNQVPVCTDCNSERGNTDVIDWHQERDEPVPRIVWGKYLKLYRDQLWKNGKLHTELPEEERERWNGVEITRNITRRIRSSHIKRDEAGRPSSSDDTTDNEPDSTEQETLDSW